MVYTLTAPIFIGVGRYQVCCMARPFIVDRPESVKKNTLYISIF